jgi:hypothetical protein
VKLDSGENRGRSRPIVLIVVLALHVSMLALLLANSRTLKIAGAIEHPVQLMYLPAQEAPKVRVENNPARRLSAAIAVLPAPPLLTSSRADSVTWNGHGSDTDGHGTGVNWAAEAHRAIRAYEIRRDQTANSALSVSSTLDERGAREHHAGDRQKTADGDWIVWINGDCYQVASWHSGPTAPGTLSPEPICRPAAAPRTD